MKKVNINIFKIISIVHFEYGYTHLKWNVENALFTILFSKNFIKIVSDSSEIKILANKSEDLKLLALGLFSFSIKTISTKTNKVIKKNINLGKFVSKKILTKNDKPKLLSNHEIRSDIVSINLKKLNIRPKPINPQI
tara:strand:+ start:304 stop:714 length:411 start_codon:yes stop_codon:yes gene_type:complete